MTQADLARASGLSTGGVTNIINNTRRPGQGSLNKIARALKLPPEEVYRAAGLLPTRPNDEVDLEEWHYLLRQLSDQDREEMKQIALLKIERQERQQRRRPAEGAP